MTFEERYVKFRPILMQIAKKYARTTPIPVEEYESTLNEEFFLRYGEFDPKRNNNFGAFMRVILVQKAVKLASRKERRFYDSIQYIEVPDDADEDARYPMELVSDVDIEEQVFDVMFVEEQLENAEGETRLILQEFFGDPSASFREIARNLGLNDKLVKRRLQAVAENIREGAVSNA